MFVPAVFTCSYWTGFPEASRYSIGPRLSSFKPGSIFAQIGLHDGDVLTSIEGESMGRVFGYAWFQGLVCYVVSLYWIEFTLHHFAGVNPILAAGPLVLLAAIMALFAGLAIWAAEFATVRLGLPIFVTMPIAWPAPTMTTTDPIWLSAT